MIRLLVVLLLATVPLGSARAACGDATGERGVALLIGVSNYRAPAGAAAGDGWAPLANAVRDVDEVCAGLDEAGFRTIALRDPTFEQLDAAIFDFHNAAMQADYAIVYYAGHGFEFRGQSYIVPVDAPQDTSLTTLVGDFVPMSRLLNAAAASRQFGLFLLDACRTREQAVEIVDAAAGEPGNAPGAVGLVSVPGGAVIFSTVSGRPALDAAPLGSELSPFASAIIAGMEVPGLELTDFYAFVHEDVVRRTGDMAPLGPQYPALYKVAPKKFYLVEPPSQSVLALLATQMVSALATAPRIELPPLERLAVEDEPKLIREVLAEHGFPGLVAAAERRNPVAQYLLGYAYEFGIGVEPDLAQASRWLERSAAQDHPGGLLELAYFLQHQAEADGSGLTAEQRTAMTARAGELYERSAATGFAKAQSHLGAALWSQAANKPLDEQAALQQRAVGLFDQASAAGHVYATFALAAYAPDRRALAEERLRAIAAAGNAQGSHWLCQLYYFLGDAAAAEDHCERAALSGFAASRAVYATILATRTIARGGPVMRGGLCRGEGADRIVCADNDSGGGYEVPDEEAREQAAYWAGLALTEPELATIPDLQAVAQDLARRPGE